MNKSLMYTIILALLIFLYTLPAGIFEYLLNRANIGVYLAGSYGSIWDGGAQVQAISSDKQAKLVIANGFKWKFSFNDLLHGRILWNISSVDMVLKSNLLVSSRCISIYPIDMYTDASLLSGIGDWWDSLSPLGKIRFQSSGIGLGHCKHSSSMDAYWRGAGFSQEGLYNLGDFKLNIKIDDKGATYNIITLKGPLHIEGSGSANASNSYFKGKSWVDGERKSSIMPMLSILGEPRGSVVYLNLR